MDSGDVRHGPSAEGAGPSFQADTRIVDKLIEELKSQGMFDQIRKDCLQEVDTKPAYQNLRSRVEDTVSRYMSKQQRNWSPSANKAQLRTKLRRHIEDSKHMEDGVERIVEQVVNPKILSAIQPRVETIICNYLGIDKLEDEEPEVTNGDSNLQSSDVEMKEAVKGGSDTSSPGPGLRGDMSPLTPDRKDAKTPTLRGDVSPLTPPRPVERVPTPNTPPMPPPEDQKDEDMSPVSDTELADVSPPKPSPPPLPDTVMLPPLPPPLPTHMPRPPPLPEASTPPPPPNFPPTSPIGSSSDDIKPTSISDISETDLPGSESDLEHLEAQRLKIERQLAQAKISESEGEVHTSDSDSKKLEGSPISSDDHEEEKSKDKKRKDDTDSDGGNEPNKDVSNIPLPKVDEAKESREKETEGQEAKDSKESKEKDAKDKETKDKEKREKEKDKEHRKHHHKHHKSHRHKDKHRDDKKKEHKKDEKKEHKKEDKKEDKKDKERRKSEKYGKLTEKVNKADNLKSDKFKSFDMFAPKPKKPQVVTTPRPSSSSSMSSPGSFGLVTPPSFGSKTPPVFGYKSKPPPPPPSSGKTPKSKVKKYVEEAKKELKAEKKARLELLEPQRKVFPELHVSKCGEDKLKQHEDDYLQAKRNLQKKREELMQKKELEKLRRRYSDSKRSPDVETPKEPKKTKRIRRYSDDSSDDEPKKETKVVEEEEVELKVDRPKRVKTNYNDDIERQMEEMLGEEKPDKIESQNILQTDKVTKHLIGFDEDDLVGLPKSTLLYDYLIMADDHQASVTVTEKEQKVLLSGYEPEDGYLYLENLTNPQKTVMLLKTFGGNPKVVNPVPAWLKLKFDRWQLKREEVELILDATKVRKRRNITTESEYDSRFPSFEHKKNKLDDEGFRGFNPDDIKPITVLLPESEFIDQAGLTFGMLSPPRSGGEFDEIEPDLQVDQRQNQHFMSVELSQSLVQHFKQVLDEEFDVENFSLPPSPISCPSSNASEQGLNSPKNGGAPPTQKSRGGSTTTRTRRKVNW